MVSRRQKGKGEMLGFRLRGNGAYRELLALEAGGSRLPASHDTVDKKQHFIKMNGNTTFKVAVRTMAEDMEELLTELKVSPDKVKLLIPHQANIRIIQAVGERLKFPAEKVFVNVQKYGNTSAATIPMALFEAAEEGKIKRGDLVACVAFGGGLTSGACLIRY
jgi:3-oxoacyl-[acyl-carrier-protein] synthase-3